MGGGEVMNSVSPNMQCYRYATGNYSFKLEPTSGDVLLDEGHKLFRVLSFAGFVVVVVFGELDDAVAVEQDGAGFIVLLIHKPVFQDVLTSKGHVMST